MFAPFRYLSAVFTIAVVAVLAGFSPEAHAVIPLAPSGVKVDLTKALDADSAAQAGVAYDSSASYLIRWTDNAYDEEGYRVEVRLGNAGSFTPLQYLSANSSSCVAILPHFPKDTLLQFMVSAYKYNGANVEYSYAPVFGYTITDAASAFTAPTGLTAVMEGDGVVKLKWTDNSTTEIYHQVLFKKQADATFTHAGYVYFNVTEAAIQPGLLPGTTYDFQVRATRKAPQDGTSFGGVDHITNVTNTASVAVPALLAPTGLLGSVTSETTVQLSWTDNSTNETAYQVEYRQLPATDFTSLGTVAANTKSITVPTPPATTVEWRVRAIYKTSSMTTAVESAPTTPTVQLSTSFPAPTELVATTSPKAGAVDLTWKDNSTSEGGFEILTRPAGTTGEYLLALVVPGGTTTATIGTRTNAAGTDTEPLEVDQTHEFVVRAFYGSAESGSTNVATAAAKAGFTSRFYNGGTMGVPYNNINQYVLATSPAPTVTDGVKNWDISGLSQVGLSFDKTTGIVSGSPTKSGVFTFPMTASFTGGWVAHGTLTLRILNPRAAVTSTAIPDTTIAPNTTFTIPLATKFFDPESERAVRMETSKGNIDILLYPSLAPEAVANFLAYVKGGDYDGVVFHRSLADFVLQGGGFKPVGTPKSFKSVTARPSPKNEPGISNLMGTISAAKVGNNPHSATHDFFLNLADNNIDNPLSSVPALDNQNGGFTVFGRVATTSENRNLGLSIVYPVLDTIAKLPRGNYIDFNSSGGTDASLDKRILVDGSPVGFSDWPMNVAGSTAPTDMDVLKNVFITSAYEIPVLNYSVFANTAPDVVSATIVDGVLQLRGLKAGVSVVTVKATDLEATAAQRSFEVTVTANYKGPVITKQPASQAVVAGAKATFSVTATGTDLTYQWRKADNNGNFINLNGETGKTLTIANVQSAQVGSYDVLVGNDTTILTSTPARLDFKAVPTVTNPVAQVVNLGDPLTLEVETTGAPAPTVAWYRGASPVAGQTNPKLSIAATKITDGGVYTARATNASGKVTSAAANVYVVDKGTVVTTVKQGGKASLKAGVSGPVTGYQWRKNGVDLNGDNARITGTTGPVLTISGALFTDSDSYTCAVTVPDAGLGPLVTGIQKLAVVVRPSLSNYTAATGVVGFQYDFTVPYDQAVTNTPTKFTLGNLPPGLTYNSATGRITGRPLKAGRYSVGTVIGNVAGNSDAKIGTMDILPMSQYGVGTFVAAVEPSVLNGNKGGRLDLTMLDSGTYTGKLVLGAESYSIKGAMVYYPGAFAPQAQIIVTRKGKTPILVSFAIDEADGDLGGQVTDGLVVSQVTGFRQFWHANWNPSGFFAGSYNLAINLKPADVGNAAIPQGSGYATATVTLGGTALIATRLPDNTSITSSSIVGPRGQFLMFQMLYKNTGSMLGTPALGTVNLGTGSQRIIRAAGEFRWIKDAQTAADRSYKPGFGPVDMAMIGRNYRAPAAGSRVLDLPAANNNVSLDFTEGGLAASQTNPDVVFTLPSSNVPQLPVAGSAQNPGKVKLNINASTGTYSGSFELSDPTAPKRPVTFQGLLIPRIPTTPAIAATQTTAAVAEIAGSDPLSPGYFVLNQLPSVGPPATTLTTSPLLSGRVQLKPKAIIINSVTTNPVTNTVNPGTAYSFTVAATGDGTLTYQWRKNGASIATATAATYSIPSVAEADQANYDVVVSNGATSATSTAVVLNVNDPVTSPTITRTPAGTAVATGAHVVFTAAAQGAGPFTYQWYKDGDTDAAKLDGATGVTYTIDPANASHNGSYKVKVFSAVTPAGVLSSASTLTVIDGVSNVVATRTPADQTIAPGGSVTFQVTASGAGTLTYQWRKGSSNISGATGSSYTISPLDSDDTGSYDVVVRNEATPNGVPSNAVPLNVSNGVMNVTASRLPSDAAVAVGTTVTFSVTAGGAGPFGYQWRKDGTPMPGETNQQLTVTPLQPGTAVYDVLVSDSQTPNGLASNGVELIAANPVTNVQVMATPSGNISVGGSVSFTVTADGTGPLFYQWRKGGGNLDGATSNTYNINNASDADNGDYDVVVTNSVSSVPSAPTTLTVSP